MIASSVLSSAEPKRYKTMPSTIKPTITHVTRRLLCVTVIIGGSSLYTRDPERRRAVRSAHSRPVFLNLHHGGVVFCIEGSSHIDRIQAASRGRPSLRSPKPRFAATSSDTARVKCAIVGGP